MSGLERERVCRSGLCEGKKRGRKGSDCTTHRKEREHKLRPPDEKQAEQATNPKLPNCSSPSRALNPQSPFLLFSDQQPTSSATNFPHEPISLPFQTTAAAAGSAGSAVSSLGRFDAGVVVASEGAGIGIGIGTAEGGGGGGGGGSNEEEVEGLGSPSS